MCIYIYIYIYILIIVINNLVKTLIFMLNYIIMKYKRNIASVYVYATIQFHAISTLFPSFH